MKRCVLAAMILGVAAFLSACGTSPAADGVDSEPEIHISGVVIRNELDYPVTDVLLEVPATRDFAGCGTILPHSECNNTFQRIDYRANAVVIQWKERGQPHQTDEFKVDPPAGARPGDAFRVEVIVFAPGQAGARLVDAESGEVRSR